MKHTIHVPIACCYNLFNIEDGLVKPYFHLSFLRWSPKVAITYPTVFGGYPVI